LLEIGIEEIECFNSGQKEIIMHIFKSQNPSKSLFPVIFFFLFVLLTPQSLMAHADGESLDKIADVISWVALIIGPIIAIVVFLLIHILPEKIAEKKNHPQAHAIKVLCLLSLAFGGILWPLAWLWAYSKPVLYKMAYGTDKGEYHELTFKDLADAASTEKNKTVEEKPIDH
jgi:cytochrome bd-type quinol oxidase subunit 2